jgi:hypothetical protein
MIQGAPRWLQRAAGVAIELFQWWRAEMLDLGRASLHLLPSRRSPQLLMKIGDRTVLLEQRVGKGWNPMRSISQRDDGEWPAELPELEPDLRNARTSIVLPAAEIYFEDFDLPVAATRHLGTVLRL